MDQELLKTATDSFNLDIVKAYNKGKSDGVKEFWTEFDREIKSKGRQSYYYTEFLRIGMIIRDRIIERENKLQEEK